MNILRIILAIWLGGWLISAGVYVWSSMKRARIAGTSWSPTRNLTSITALVLTWLPSIILYVYVRAKARSGGW
jgi:hypothetical protein